MNKKTIFKLVLLLLISFSTKNFSQTVVLNVSTVNNSTISSSQPITINANTTANVSLETQVTLANAPSDNYPGTIKIYYQRNSSNPINVANGGDGGGLLFLGSTTAYRSFNITLNSGQFDASGGYIYSEYQTNSGIKYKSANRAVVVSTPTGGGGTGGGGSSSATCGFFENVPYGGIPLLPQLIREIPGVSKTTWVIGEGNYDVPFNNVSDKRVFESFIIYQRTDNSSGPSRLSCRFRISVKRPFPNVNRLRVSNDIKATQYLLVGSIPQTIVGNSAFIAATGRNTPSIPVNNYQWQKRIAKPTPLCEDYINFCANYSWTDIPNATQQNYTPSNPSTIATEYRRLVIDATTSDSERASASSNVIGIYPINNSNISNTICCNQEVYSNQNVNIINGSISTLQNIRYQWQLKNSRDPLNPSWEDIDGADEKDYTPVRPMPSGRRGETLISNEFRRVIISDDLVYYPSNSIIINYYNTSNRMAFNLENKNNLHNEEITFYPNPVKTSLNIKNINSYSYVNINIIDLTGRVLYSNKINNLESNEFPLDVSNLPKGLYNLIIETKEKQINFKFVKE